MENARPQNPLIPYCVLIGMGLAATLLVVYGTSKYGIGLDADSVTYIQVARALAAGRGISDAFTLQPPFYPMLLALGGAFIDPLAFGVWLHAFLFGALLMLTGAVLLRELPNSTGLALLGVLGVLLARPLLGVASVAYSELAFIFLEMVTLFGLARFLQTERARWLALAICASAGAAMTRYIGVALIVTGACALLLFWQTAWRKKFLYAFVFVSVAALPLVVWAARNILISGEAFGARGTSRFTLQENIVLTARTFANWFAPNPFAWLVFAALVVLGAILLFEKTRARKSPGHDARFFYVGALFCVIYLALLIGTATTTAYNRIGSRLLSPLFIPAWMLFVYGVYQVVVSRGRRIQIAACLVLVLTLLFPLQSARTHVERSVTDGAGGFNTTRWRASETIQYAIAHRAELLPTVYSNFPDALYILADIPAQSVLPKVEYASNDPAFRAQDLRGAFPAEASTLIWFNLDARDDFLFTLAELNEFTQLDLLQTLRDGAVYRMDKQKN